MPFSVFFQTLKNFLINHGGTLNGLQSMCQLNVNFKFEKKKLLNEIKRFKPSVSSVKQARILLVGPVGVGKSSFFNSINSVFHGHITSQAVTGTTSESSLTLKIEAGQDGEPLPFILCDTMGLEKGLAQGLNIEDIPNILNGKIGDRDKIHVSGVPQVLLLTKVDHGCPPVEKDIQKVYHSVYLQKMIKDASAHLGIPLLSVFPVKNYTCEVELQQNDDILLLSALQKILSFANDYIRDMNDKSECSLFRKNFYGICLKNFQLY
uniref:G domain-containing protein n=1 Tax=Scleropages formosus TaxID=113540 RepID=A0A8C9VVQ2_SCLFO